MNCPNCGSKLTCGCQKRSTKKGKQGCSNCITQLQMQETQEVSKTKK